MFNLYCSLFSIVLAVNQSVSLFLQAFNQRFLDAGQTAERADPSTSNQVEQSDDGLGLLPKGWGSLMWFYLITSLLRPGY